MVGLTARATTSFSFMTAGLRSLSAVTLSPFAGRSSSTWSASGGRFLDSAPSSGAGSFPAPQGTNYLFMQTNHNNSHNNENNVND
jgi:hypothetical protein